MENIYKRFESIREFNAYLENGTVQPAFNKNSWEREDPSWTGTQNFDEAQNKMLFGDKDLLDAVENEGVKKTRANIHKFIQRRQTFSSVVGFAPNVPAYLAGAPNSMIAQRYVKTRAKVVNVLFNGGFDCSVKTEDSIRVCAKVLSAIIMLEASGTRVNLYTSIISTVNAWSKRKNEKQTAAAVVKIKDSRNALDVLRVIYPTVNPSWVRRHFLKFIGITEGTGDDFSSCFGSPVTTKEQRAEICEALKIKNAVILDFYEIRNKTTEEVLKSITGEAKR